MRFITLLLSAMTLCVLYANALPIEDTNADATTTEDAATGDDGATFKEDDADDAFSYQWRRQI